MCARMYARERSKQKGEVVWRSSEVVFSTSDVNATTSEVDAHTFDRKEIHCHRQAKRGKKTFTFSWVQAQRRRKEFPPLKC